MASRSYFAMKDLQVSGSTWKQSNEAKTSLGGSGSSPLSALWKLLKDKKNICRVEDTDTQELNQAGYVLDYKINQRLSVHTV